MQTKIKMSPQSVLQYLPNHSPPLSKSCDLYLTLEADEHGEVLPVIANDNTVTQQGQLFLHFLKSEEADKVDCPVYRCHCVHSRLFKFTTTVLIGC